MGCHALGAPRGLLALQGVRMDWSAYGSSGQGRSDSLPLTHSLLCVLRGVMGFTSSPDLLLVKFPYGLLWESFLCLVEVGGGGGGSNK